MAGFDAQKCAQYIKKHANPLIVAGDGCDRIRLDGTRLADYAARLAVKLACPIAATGNTLVGLAPRGELAAKKMWLAELFRYLTDQWAEPLVAARPDLLILIGYRPESLHGMVAGLKGIHTVHLGPGKLACANRTVGESTLAQWKQTLDELISAL